MSGPFRPSELTGADRELGSAAEQADLLAVARELESLAAIGDIRPTDGFEARVLAAIASEPLPRPTAAAGLAARRGRLGAMLAALRDTWRVAWRGGRPAAVRAQAMAFVVVAVVAAGSLGGLAAVGALGLLEQASPVPVVSPLLTPGPSSHPSLEPLTSPSPSASPETTLGPSPSGPDDSSTTATPEPTKTPRATATSGSTETPHASASPVRTPEATETPHPSGTPEPSDDHGGGGGGVETPKP
jgi:hypothetical protein